MNRLAPVKFVDDRARTERTIELEFIPISTDLKRAYAEFSQLVWDYMGKIGSPPIREINELLEHWLLTKAKLSPQGYDREDLERILGLVFFLSELCVKSKYLEWHEGEGKDAFDYVNSHPELKEVSREK